MQRFFIKRSRLVAPCIISTIPSFLFHVLFRSSEVHSTLCLLMSGRLFCALFLTIFQHAYIFEYLLFWSDRFPPQAAWGWGAKIEMTTIWIHRLSSNYRAVLLAWAQAWSRHYGSAPYPGRYKRNDYSRSSAPLIPYIFPPFFFHLPYSCLLLFFTLTMQHNVLFRFLRDLSSLLL